MPNPCRNTSNKGMEKVEYVEARGDPSQMNAPAPGGVKGGSSRGSSVVASHYTPPRAISPQPSLNLT